MSIHLRAGVIAALGVTAMFAVASANADTLFASAGYVNNLNNEPGAYLIDSTAQNLIAATFTLTQGAQITSIGGVFTQYGDSAPIYGTIIAAPLTQTAVNTTTLPGLALGTALFAPPVDGSDATASLSAPLILAAGTYEVVFGSGLFGATGNSGLATGQNGTANLLQSVDGGATWGALADSVRITVSGTAVPLPAGLPMLGSALLAGGVWLRRRRPAPLAA